MSVSESILVESLADRRLRAAVVAHGLHQLQRHEIYDRMAEIRREDHDFAELVRVQLLARRPR